jgi:hypothetical protein
MFFAHLVAHRLGLEDFQCGAVLGIIEQQARGHRSKGIQEYRHQTHQLSPSDPDAKARRLPNARVRG